MTTTEKILLSWGKNPLTNLDSYAIIKKKKRGNNNEETEHHNQL